MSSGDVILSGEILPAADPAAPPFSEADVAALRRAVQALERPGLAARLSAAAGTPIEMLGRSLPTPVMDAVAKGTEAALRTAIRVALATLPKGEAVATAAGLPAPPAAAAEGRFSRLFGSGEGRHRAMAAVSGALGGAFGLATIAVELPVSTTLMLRSIAEIAREEGEDIATPEGALACIQVFALGGGKLAASAETGSTLTESGYFAVRAALAKTMAEAAKYAGTIALADQSGPALMRFAAQVAARFGIVVSEKVAAQAVPILGAVGGAAVNTVFMSHFQATARAHFTIRRLERTYGGAAVRAAYEVEKAALGPA
ncbi:EcsC family protein [Methylobacterium sp. J-076]|uniref:EcsC family protein n=1 Tax=Methylobacterium sp. J-076 TaxID=2836655 RepID=UPI001FBB0322|nr:EcsC family protein [Methylobacterium sp. J-076]MCJ2013823.1 EcsC family protein [Methylobacterium sp. J-076]